MSRLRTPGLAATTAAAAAAGAAVAPVYGRLAGAVIRHNVARLRAGDLRPLLRTYSRDVQFRFPGEHSWAIEARGRDELGRWLARFVDAGLQLYVEDVFLKGPPWATRFAIVFHDHVSTNEGDPVYENKGVLAGTMARGRVRRYEAHLDTQRVSRFDEWISAHGGVAARATG